jgi:cysteine desulfurase
MASRVYLDHNATSPVRPAVADSVACALAQGGNPSSVHAEGRAARIALESAREAVAALVGAAPSDVVFTGGGTEGNNTALSPSLTTVGDCRPVTRLLVSAIEHPCVLAGGRFGPDAVERVPVQSTGSIDLDALEVRLDAMARERPDERVLVAVQAANNETGVIQPVAAVARLVHGHGGLVHCDAVQAVGKVGFDLASWGVDCAVLSAHKLGGPQGVGAIVLAPGLALGEPLLRGGAQERGRRAGTPNVAGIAGFGTAARLAAATLATEGTRLARLRDSLEAELRRLSPDIVIFASDQPRLPHTSLFALPGLAAETALMAFDLDGIAVSSGSACSSGKVAPSHVLSAMAVPPEVAAGAIRVSFGWTSREEDVIRLLAAFEKLKSAFNHRTGRRAA